MWTGHNGHTARLQYHSMYTFCSTNFFKQVRECAYNLNWYKKLFQPERALSIHRLLSTYSQYTYHTSMLYFLEDAFLEQANAAEFYHGSYLHLAACFPKP